MTEGTDTTAKIGDLQITLATWISFVRDAGHTISDPAVDAAVGDARSMLGSVRERSGSMNQNESRADRGEETRVSLSEDCES